MENNVIVSVIIPAYNVCGYIKECLESCKRQNFNETEFIVINDGSTDGTKEEIEEFIKSDSRFQLIDKQNQGVTAAREDGLKVAKGKYVFFWRTRQTLWRAVQMLTQKLCCQTIHDCPKVVPLHYESE